MIIWQSPTKHTQRPKGIAMLAVLLALVVATILANAFLAKQSTAVAIGENQKDHTMARHMAESALAFVLDQMQNDQDWRVGLNEGAWIDGVDWMGGKVTVAIYDGEDVDGDGTIDGDGDLEDNYSDKFTLIASASYHGLRHELRNVVRPSMGHHLGTLLLVTDSVPLDAPDMARKLAFQSWGWTVIALADNDSLADYGNALAQSDVVYVTQSVSPGSLGSKVNAQSSIGIVNECGEFNDELQITSQAWVETTSDNVRIETNQHYITEPFVEGPLEIQVLDRVACAQGTVASGAETLISRSDGAVGCWLAVETGAALVNGQQSAGRRVAIPLDVTNFDFTDLSTSGQELVKRSLWWTATSDPSDHLVAHWKYNQSAGQVAIDSSGHGNHATLTNVGSGAEWVPGKMNNAIDFDGSGLAYARAPDSDSLDLDYEGTIAAWIKCDSITNFMGIVHKGERTDWVDEAYSLQFWTSRKLALTFTTVGGGGARCYGNTVIDTGQWYHVVGTWNATGMRLYVNGQLDASVSQAYVADTSDGSVQVGSQLSSFYNSGYKNFPFNGVVDDVRIYSRSLTQPEIEGIYNTGTDDEDIPTLVAEYTFSEPPPIHPQLVGHWKLDEAGSGGGGAAAYVGGTVNMRNQSQITSYDSAVGAYGGANVGANASLVANTTNSGGVFMDSSVVHGDVWVGQGSDPSQVIQFQNTANISGAQQAQSTNATMPNFTSPIAYSDQDYQLNGGNYTINFGGTVRNLVMYNNATITISGNQQFDLYGDLTVNGGGIQVPAGSSLLLRVRGSVYLQNGAYIGNDTSGTGRITIIQYDSGGQVLFDNNNTVVGSIQAGGNVRLRNQSVLYGSLVTAGNLDLDTPNGLRLDEQLAPSLDNGINAAIDTIAADGESHEDGQASQVFPGQTGAHDSAYAFDGTGHVLVPHNDLQTPDSGTIACWFQVDAATGRQTLLSKDSSGYDNGGQFTLYTDGGQLAVTLESSMTSYTLATAGVTAGQWHHAAFSFGPKGFKLYLDGSLAASNAYNGGLGQSSGGMGNNEPLVFAAGTQNSGNNTHETLSDFLVGQLDDVRVYDDQVTDTQLLAVMNDTDLVPEPANTVPDVSGYGAAMDLVIDDLSKIEWLSGGGMRVKDPVGLHADDAAKLYDALTGTGQLSMEMIFTPDSVEAIQAGNLAGMIGSGGSRNFAFHQDGNDLAGYVRSTDTNGFGEPGALDDNALTASVSRHVILAYDGENTLVYRDGNETAVTDQVGSLNWTFGHGFYVASDPVGGTMTGRLKRVAIYDKGINLLQAENVFSGKHPGNPKGDDTIGYLATWHER